MAFTGQLGVANFDGLALYGHGEVHFFFGPNATAAINGGITTWDEDGEPTIIGRWGAELETSPFAGPLSVLLSYEGMAYFEPDEGRSAVHQRLQGRPSLPLRRRRHERCSALDGLEPIHRRERRDVGRLSVEPGRGAEPL